VAVARVLGECLLVLLPRATPLSPGRKEAGPLRASLRVLPEAQDLVETAFGLVEALRGEVLERPGGEEAGPKLRRHRGTRVRRDEPVDDRLWEALAGALRDQRREGPRDQAVPLERGVHAVEEEVVPRNAPRGGAA